MNEKNRETSPAITFLISSLSGGGAEGVAVNLANSLADLGWEVNLIVLHLKNAIYKTRLSPEVNLISLEVNNIRYSLVPLGRFFINNKVDQIVVFNKELSAVAVLIRFLLKKQFKIISRNINTISELKKQPTSILRRMLMRPIADFLFKKVDHVVNQCKGMESDFLKNYPNLKNKTSVIYNPVADYIERVSKNIDNNTPRGNYLLCVGRLEKQKAFHYAINAFSTIHKEFPELVLKIVGQGSLKESLVEYAYQLGVGQAVEFEGFHENLIPYYKGARATLLTSLYEGFPNVLVESLRMGTPVVAFDCPSGPNELIINGKNGFLVDYLNVEDLSKGIRKVLKSDFRRTEIRDSIDFLDKKNILCQWVALLGSEALDLGKGT